MTEISLLALFREEVAEHVTTLTQGLLVAESSAPEDTRPLEPLMRAAHSLKGAARVVELDTAVRVAHAMEDALVAAQRHELTLSPPRIDALLRGVDWITSLAAVPEDSLPVWLVAQAAETEALIDTLTHLERLGETAPDSAPSAATAVDAAAGTAQAGAAIESPAPATPTPQPIANDDTDRAVKISADVVDRLLGLTSESVIEAHRIEALGKALQGIRAHHVRLGAGLKRLRARLADGASGPELIDLTDSSEALLEWAQDALARSLEDFDNVSRRSALIAEELFQWSVASRQRPFADGTAMFPRLVRDLARDLGKRVRFEISGQETRVDREILDKLEAPLRHLLQNAVDHGLEGTEERRVSGKPEAGLLRLEARHRGGALIITVSDDGRGIDRDSLRARIVERSLTSAETAARLNDAELFDFLFLPGVTTRASVDAVSGRGVGLDAVQSMVQTEGGALSVSSNAGRGACFVLRLPVTRSVIRALLVSIEGEPYAFPLTGIEQVLKLAETEISTVEGRSYVTRDERRMALVRAAEILELDDQAPSGETLHAVVIGESGGHYAVEVDEFLGERELAVRPLDPRLGKVPHVSSTSTTEDGVPVLVLDTEDLVRSIHALVSGGRRVGSRNSSTPSATRAPRVLIVDDSITVRELERHLLQNHGYDVDVAVDGIEGWNALRLGGYDLVISDVDMPRMNGIDLIKRIREDPRLNQLPVMILSYKDREEDRLRGLDAGADRYFAKSGFRDDALIEAVRDLIGRTER
ncbi:hybrid sensor histidine kinase/response regulator [Methylotetracoccus oryzae]|uniref:hybrid sensor histidine kinase/response regulator n=1 Tax=Methylotetracoccus oryzae TaxID=1919059 RepID=UPI00111B0C66|nr:hybrid sensor histidine kinase/response regulator [Methylotetracoccus oryzae]